MAGITKALELVKVEPMKRLAPVSNDPLADRDAEALAKEIEDQVRHQMMGVPLAVVDTEAGEGPSESTAEPDVGGVAESS